MGMMCNCAFAKLGLLASTKQFYITKETSTFISRFLSIWEEGCASGQHCVFFKTASVAGCGAAVALSDAVLVDSKEKETLRSLIFVLYSSTLSVVKFRGAPACTVTHF